MKLKVCRDLLLGVILFSTAGSHAFASSTIDPLHDIPFSDAQFSIDANLDDPIWSDARTIDLAYETKPGENLPARVKTEARIVENGSFFLVSFKAYDPEPEKIRGFYNDRDAAYNDDYVGVVIDSFNDERRAFKFFVNPLGAQIDMIQDDISRREDDSWNATWKSSAKITDDGYIVEMAIPLNILRFRSDVDVHTWGLDFVRFYPRVSRFLMASNPQDVNLSCYLCQLKKYTGLKNVKPSENLEVVPTFVASQNETRQVEPISPWEKESDADLSLDVRWGITPSNTINLTVNPDFSQVEADSAQLSVNNTFSLYFAERRPFFLDSADYFEGLIDLVHTRNIVAPNLGVKYTMKKERDTGGVIFADDDFTNILLPRQDGSRIESINAKSENAIFRYRRDIGKYSSLGIVSTARQADDYNNRVISIDGKTRFSDTDAVRFEYATTSTDNPESLVLNNELNLNDSQHGDGRKIRYDHNSRNWFAYVEHQHYDPEFRADLGFISRVNYDYNVFGLGHIWRGDTEGWWHQFQLWIDVDVTHQVDTDDLVEREQEIFFGVNGPMQSYYEVSFLDRDQLYEGVQHQENSVAFYGEFSPFSGLNANGYLRVGDALDVTSNRIVDSINLEPSVQWNARRDLYLSLSANFLKFEDDVQELFTAYSANTELTYYFTIKNFLRFSLQSSHVDRNLAAYAPENNLDEKFTSRAYQLLYSHKFTPQTVLFLGYSEGGYQNDTTDSFRNNGRTAFLKFSYAWFPGQ